MKSKPNKILKNSCLGILGLGVLFIVSLPFLFKQAFGPTYKTVEIKQDIGGVLICNSEYNADLASWFYDVDYEYVNSKGDSIKIGSGEYYGEEWPKNEQIQMIDEWLILKTGGDYGSDKLLIGKDLNSNWREIKISPNEIEKDSLWKTKNIFVKQKCLPQESAIKDISENGILVEYQYRTGETVEEQETRIITYKFDKIEGIPKMEKIELKE